MKVTRLVCGSCGHPLYGLGTDIVFICSNCGAGWISASEGLQPVQVEHRARRGDGIALPFWKVSATVHVLKRTVRNEFTTTILRFGSRYDGSAMPGKTRETEGGSARREFLFPAFHLDGLPGTGVSLSSRMDRLPGLLDGSEEYPKVCGGSISAQDAEVLARCIAVGQETEKADWLAEIELVISAVKSRLVVLPCTVEVEKVSVAETGVSFFRRSVPGWEGIADLVSG